MERFSTIRAVLDIRETEHMEIILNDGKQEILVRGGETCIELCEKRQRKGVDIWEARGFYHDPLAALEAVLKRRIRNCDARTLKELKEAIEQIRSELIATYSTEIRLPKNPPSV